MNESIIFSYKIFDIRSQICDATLADWHATKIISAIDELHRTGWWRRVASADYRDAGKFQELIFWDGARRIDILVREISARVTAGYEGFHPQCNGFWSWWAAEARGFLQQLSLLHYRRAAMKGWFSLADYYIDDDVFAGSRMLSAWPFIAMPAMIIASVQRSFTTRDYFSSSLAVTDGCANNNIVHYQQNRFLSVHGENTCQHRPGHEGCKNQELLRYSILYTIIGWYYIVYYITIILILAFSIAYSRKLKPQHTTADYSRHEAASHSRCCRCRRFLSTKVVLE